VKATATELYFDGIAFRKLNDREMEVYVLIHKKSGETAEERFSYTRLGFRHSGR